MATQILPGLLRRLLHAPACGLHGLLHALGVLNLRSSLGHLARHGKSSMQHAAAEKCAQDVQAFTGHGWVQTRLE